MKLSTQEPRLQTKSGLEKKTSKYNSIKKTLVTQQKLNSPSSSSSQGGDNINKKQQQQQRKSKIIAITMTITK